MMDFIIRAGINANLLAGTFMLAEEDSGSKLPQHLQQLPQRPLLLQRERISLPELLSLRVATRRQPL